MALDGGNQLLFIKNSVVFDNEGSIGAGLFGFVVNSCHQGTGTGLGKDRSP